MALIFGAPETVPAGNPANNDLNLEYLLLYTPVTLETICITCEYLSIVKLSVTFTVLILETLPASFLPKSNNIKCSESSFLSLSRSFS